jgi:flagellar biosynthesis protein FlhF
VRQNSQARQQIHSEAQDLHIRFANLLKHPEHKAKKYPSPPGPPAKQKQRGKVDPAEVAVWRDQLIDNILIKEPLPLISFGGQHIIALVGATGVGKTTTAAKLAALYSLRQGKKVCLLSMDCYRIGATDQLRTYARIMRLPCEIVLRKNELKRAIERHADKDVIIIDTAGKSPYDEGHIQELREWFAPVPGIQPHLVLSATTKKEDILSSLKVYAPLAVNSLVLSKLDETRAYAALCQQVVSSELPISYLCTGQRVPEDFYIASKEFLDKLFKKGWHAAVPHYAGEAPRLL